MPNDTTKPVQTPTANWRELCAKLGPLVGLLFVVVLFGMLSPKTFLTRGNLEIMLLQTAVVGTAALGMTLIIVAGGIDLSVGSNVALCTVVVALLLGAGASPLLAAAGGIATGMLCGLAIGALVAYGRMAPFVVTLGAWGALRGIAKGLARESIVMAPATGLNNLLRSLRAGEHWRLLPTGVWLLLGCALAVAWMLRNLRFGRHVFAVGSSAPTARLCGVRVARTQLAVYAVGAAFAGLAGVLQFAYLTVGDPTTATGMELDVIAAVVIGGASLSGGQGSIAGSLVGALIMTVVANGCTKVGLPNWVQEIVTGVIIVAAVALDRMRNRARRFGGSSGGFSGA